MEKHEKPKNITWTAGEERRERSVDWFWTVGAIALAIALASLLVHNWLFSILILLAGFTIITNALRKPRHNTYSITPTGVVVNRQLFTYNNLTSFWIEEDEGPLMLIVEIKGSFIPRLWIPLGDMEPHTVRTALAAHIPQKRYEKSLSELMSDHLGI